MDELVSGEVHRAFRKGSIMGMLLKRQGVHSNSVVVGIVNKTMTIMEWNQSGTVIVECSCGSDDGRPGQAAFAATVRALIYHAS